MSLGGALAIVALLALVLRSAGSVALVCAPLFGAVVLVISAFAGFGKPMNLLHLIGLLLVVAIGSNYALFFDQLRHQQDAQAGGNAAPIDNDTLASLALANLTAVISFCLLAFSNIPPLFAIGQVVAPGILLSLVLSAAFIPGRRR